MSKLRRPETLQPHTVVAERFQICREAGRGAMGTIFQARDLERGGYVALKLLGAHGPQALQRLHDEVTVLSGLRHPGVVAYVTHGQIPDGRPFLAMEWIEGEDLAARLQHGQLPLDEVVTLLEATARVLSAVHAHQVIHRDIKPSNMLLRGGRMEAVTLLDFGIAQYADRQWPLTSRGAVVGTPGYMAPEQARGEATLTPRVDLFALACVLYECLTGQPPFVGVHTAEILTKTLFSEPIPIQLLREETPPWLQALIESLMRKEAAERPADILAVTLAARHAPRAAGGAASGRPRGVAADREQQLIGVVATYPIASAETLSEQAQSDEASVSCGQAPPATAARAEWFVGGALVTAFPPTGHAGDQAEAVLRHALELVRRFPSARVALAMGPAALVPQRAIGGPVERALALVQDPELPAGVSCLRSVRLDGLSAKLLSRRYLFSAKPAAAAAGDASLALDTLDERPTSASAFVGRAREVQLLDEQLRLCASRNEAHTLLISAPPGGGKTRLWQEWSARLTAWPTPVLTLSGRASMMTEGSPYNVLRPMLRAFVQGQSTDPALEPRRQLLALLERWEVEALLAPFIAEIAGLPFLANEYPVLRAARDDPRIMHEHVQQAFVVLLHRLCRAASVVLIVDDMQWSDVLSTQLLAHVAAVLRNQPLLIVALGRPEFLAHQPRRPPAVRHVVRLRPLTRRACRLLVHKALGAAADPRLVQQICERSAGNPFFLEELLRDAADGEKTWPATVIAMLQARISSLDPRARRVLLAASVLGPSFPSAALDACLQDALGGAAIERTLTLHVRAGVLQPPDRDGVAERGDYRFRHELWREAAYSLLSTEMRREWHNRAAGYLATALEPDPQVVAEHYRQGPEPQKAVSWYLRAAEHGLANLSLRTTLCQLERARGCGPTGREQGLLDAIQTEALCHSGDLLAAYPYCSRALAQLRPGERWWSRCAVRAALLAAIAGRADELPAVVSDLLTAPVEDEARFALSTALVMVALSCGVIGARARMEQLLQRAEEVCLPIEQEHAALRGELLLSRSLSIQIMGEDPWRSLQLVVAAIEASEQARAHELRARSRAAKILNLIDLGNDGAAAMLGRAVVAETRQRGLAFIGLVSQCYLAQALARQASPEQWAEAEQLLSETLPLARVSSNVSYEGLLLITAGELRARRTQYGTAVSLYEQAFEKLRPCPGLRPRALWPLLRALLLTGQVAQAVELAKEAQRALESLGAQGETTIHLHLGIAAARAAQGDQDAARLSLFSAHREVMSRAARIPEPSARDRYLTAVPENQLVLAAYHSAHLSASALIALPHR